MATFLHNNTLHLRAPEPEDLEVLYKWENDTDIWKYSSTISPYSKYVLKQYIADAQTDIFQSKQLRFMITLNQANKVVGTIDLYDFDALNSRAGVGIYIDAAHRRGGFAIQALKLLQDYAFNFLNINQLYAHIPQSNNASFQLFINSGYTKTGVLQQWIAHDSRYEDAIVVQNIKTHQE